MTCDEAGPMLHALIDSELDAIHSGEVERHIASCPRCAAQLRAAGDLRAAIAASAKPLAAPQRLRLRVEAALPQPRALSRRAVLKGFALGSAASAIAATGIVVAVLRGDEEQRIAGDIVSGHLRSLQAGHLTDVLSSDQHTVKPWFNGRLDVAPPVIDLTAQGFTLIGGRLDYVDGRAIAAIVYRRRTHVINLFVAQSPGADHHGARTETVQGFNIRRWSDHGLNYWAVSDLATDELADFGDKFDAALRNGG